jgi:hypothetical protein
VHSIMYAYRRTVVRRIPLVYSALSSTHKCLQCTTYLAIYVVNVSDPFLDMVNNLTRGEYVTKTRDLIWSNSLRPVEPKELSLRPHPFVNDKALGER